MTPTLEALYRAAQKADDNFQAAVVRQFGAKEASNGRYQSNTHDAETTSARLAYHAARDRYIKACQEERKSA